MNKEHKQSRMTSDNWPRTRHALMTATADVAGEKVGEARKRLAAALERAKEIAGTVCAKAVAGAKATDAPVHERLF